MSFKFVFLSPAGELAAAMSEAVPTMEIVSMREPRRGPSRSAHGASLFRHFGPRAVGRSRPTQVVGRPSRRPRPRGITSRSSSPATWVVTNFRGIFNDHISAHIMAFVLALSRGMHCYFRYQFAGQWRSGGEASPSTHLPEATALIVGVGRDWRRDRAPVQELGHDNHWHRSPR